MLALALIHHLAIANNVPIAAVLRQSARREDLFVDYDVEHVEAEAKAFFRIEHREPVAGSGRTLFLLEPR